MIDHSVTSSDLVKFTTPHKNSRNVPRGTVSTIAEIFETIDGEGGKWMSDWWMTVFATEPE